MISTSLTLLIVVTVFEIVLAFASGYGVRLIIGKRKEKKQKIEMKKQFDLQLLQCKLETIEDTLTDISQELHDNIGQVLSMVRLSVATVKPGNPTDQKKLDLAGELLDKAIYQLRDINLSLSPARQGEQLISESINDQLQVLERTGIYKTSIDIKGKPRMISPSMHIIIYRMIQEILNNIIKHAGHTYIKAIVNYTPGELSIIISDGGKGFDVAAHSQTGHGLKNLKARAKVINAQLKIDSNGFGTTVEIKLPLND